MIKEIIINAVQFTLIGWWVVISWKISRKMTHNPITGKKFIK